MLIFIKRIPMKKYFAILVGVITLAACVRAGDYDLFPFRRSFVNSIRGYTIHDFDDEIYKGTEDIRESEVMMNKALTVKKGEAVLSDKLFDRSSYEKTIFMPNINGTLQGAFSLKLNSRQTYSVDKWVKIDGTKYYMLYSGIGSSYYLFDDDGTFYNHEGVDREGTLQIMEETVMLYPSNLKMNKITETRDEISNVRNGYEVKYGGVQLNRIWFDYLTYDGSDSSGNFERISFPDKPGLITINGKGLRVINADNNKITYMILKNDD